MKTRVAALLVGGAMGWATSSPAASAPASDGEPAFNILRDDDVVHHGGEAPLRPGSGWLALDVVDGLWRLVPATLQGEVCLRLSSRGAAGQLVGRAACWRTTGC
jgi:hypothetical protein